MRLFVLIIILLSLAPPLVVAEEPEKELPAVDEPTKAGDAPFSEEEKELIADLELLELYDLLENLNALASMEDDQ